MTEAITAGGHDAAPFQLAAAPPPPEPLLSWPDLPALAARLLPGVEGYTLWAGAVILGYPIAVFVLGEAVRRLSEQRPETAAWLRLVQNLLLPVAAAWIILTKVAGLGGGVVAALIGTVFGAVLIYIALGLLQLLLLANQGLAARAPKLLIDMLRLLLVAFGVAIVVSDAWDVDLGSLVTALGVGSVVLGLALQGVVGGMVHGIILLSGRRFGTGDVLRVGDVTGRVVQLDWMAVTLETAGNQVVIPSSDLAQKSFTVVGPAGNPHRAEVTLRIGYAHPPERVRAALLRAAAGLPQLDPRKAAVCSVAGYAEQGIEYRVTLPLAEPLSARAAQDELLSRFWYVAQRTGIGLAPEAPVEARPAPAQPGATAEARQAMLARNGALGMPGLPLAELAAIARYACYRAGEALVAEGEVPTAIFAVEAGALAVTLPAIAGATASPQRLTPGDVFAARAAFRGDPSPHRVEAIGEVGVLALDVALLQPLLARSPELARVVEKVMEAQEHAAEKLRRPARGAAGGA